MKYTNRAFALLTIAALTACGGGSTTTVTPTAPSTPSGTTAAGSMFSNMVGVGDSLTAGFQSDGLLGVSAVGNPISAFPGGYVPAGQPNGFWALVYEQATGTTAASMANPLTSVLPLINAPGIGSQLVPTATGGFAPSHPGCDGFNESAFSAAGFTTVRANPAASVRDFGVPGITAHEALNMYNPLSPTCTTTLLTSTDPTSALEPLLTSESENFIPVLGGSLSSTQAQKLKNGQPSSEVNAAAALHPTFATVWLGANDLLHYIESGGQYTGVDVVPGQMQSDVTATIVAMQHAGAQGVAVANLPTVLETPQFFRGGIPASPALCATQNYLYCDLVSQITASLVAQSVPLATAQGIAGQYAGAAVANLEGQAAYGFANDNGWYVMEGGYAVVAGTLAADIAHSVPPTSVAINLDGTNPAGSLLGQNYVSDALAAKANALNAQWNTEIDAAASNTGVALVDVNTIFNQIYTGSGPYFDAAISINPTPNAATGLPFTCCTLVFTQGLTSLDGLHPSNSGYALIANAFIQAIDTKYTSANIPPLSAGQIQAIYATDPYAHL